MKICIRRKSLIFFFFKDSFMIKNVDDDEIQNKSYMFA